MVMRDPSVERGAILFFRIAMGWTFLYAGLSQIINPKFSAVAFLSHTKTLHHLFIWLTRPNIVPVVSFAVEWGHVLIGLSLVTGCLVRFSIPWAIVLLVVYYFGHLDFPYIENHSNFIVDFHLVYAVILYWLLKNDAGLVWGVDAWLRRFRVVEASDPSSV
jgi:thiosulfate dehydrogenase [quinone] large subunit